MCSLSNTFTLAFKALDLIPQFRATTKLAEFLGATSRVRSSRQCCEFREVRVLVPPIACSTE